MFNIKPIEVNEIELLNSIIASKKNKNRNILDLKKEELYLSYQRYENNKYSIEDIIHIESIDNEIKDILQDSFNSSKKMKEVKKKIFENIYRSVCPYCMISEPTTLDHYLDKSSFPEFTIYSKNLVPCCPTCNLKKGTLFLNNGIRNIINFYYDSLPRYRFLNIELGYDNVPFIEKIILKFKEKSNINLIIINHFKNLKLEDRYKKEISDELTYIFKVFSKPTCILSREDIENCLKSQIDALEEMYGYNYWKSALHHAIVKNKVIIEAMISNRT